MKDLPSNHMDNRAYNAGEGMHDSDNSIRQAGGEDPRRAMFKPVMETKIRDHEMSGYNHNASGSQPANGGHENEIKYARMQDAKAHAMGTPMPDGTYKY